MNKRVSTKRAARNAEALLRAFTVNGKVDHKAFLAEMDARAASAGTRLTSEQYATLGKLVAAYEAAQS